jgi:hypothetical protein
MPLTNAITLQIGGSLELVLRPPAPQGETVVTVTYEGFTAIAKGNHMAYTLPAGKLIALEISYIDGFGNPAVVDGVVAWESSNPDLVPVEPDPDGKLCTVSAPGAVGTAQVKATGDADLGGGVREIITLFDIQVVAGEAVAGTIMPVGDPQDIAPVA